MSCLKQNPMALFQATGKACAAVFLGILAIGSSVMMLCAGISIRKVANQTATQAIDQFKYLVGTKLSRSGAPAEYKKSVLKGSCVKARLQIPIALQLMSRWGRFLCRIRV